MNIVLLKRGPRVQYMQAVDKPLDTALEAVRYQIAGQIAPSSQETYRRDVTRFGEWLATQGKQFAAITLDDLTAYRDWLTMHYAKSTAGRMLTVARLLVKEAYHRGLIPVNFAERLKGFTLDNESPRRALSEEECRKMLAAIDRTTKRGKRDYALLSLLIRTGIRRAEVVNLTISDIGTEGGYYILTIRHGKGDKRRIAKLQPDLYRALQAYLITREDVAPGDPLFVGIRKDGIWKNTPLHMYGGLNYILGECAQAIGVHLTPHDLRATFATLALEGKAPLVKVQYAMGHSDPRTTERYHRKKENLADNATDYIHITDD